LTHRKVYFLSTCVKQQNPTTARVNPITIKAVIFDLDGTIAAFNLDYKTVRAEVRGFLMNMGVPGSVVSVSDNIFEMLKKTELFMANAGKREVVIEKTRKEALLIAEKYELEAAARTSMLPGAIETLKELRKMDLKTALCTINSSNSTEHILKRFKISPYFDTVIPRNHVAKYKPNPEHCNLALKALGVSAEETLIVGDSITDIQAAKEIKAVSVGLSTGVSTPDQLIKAGANYLMTSITDLPTLIEGINKTENAKV
jgi:phosphoglycolate phosphatase